MSELLDALALVPRKAMERGLAIRSLRDSLQPVRVHRSPEGLWIAGSDSPALLKRHKDIHLYWTPSARQFAENRSRVRRSHPRLRQQIREIVSGGARAAEEHLAGLRGLRVLDDHQKVNVAAMALPDGYGLCVFDEQGAGKTVTCIFAFDVLVSRDEADFALIVAPKSMVPEWRRDFQRFRAELYGIDLLSGDAAAKRRALSSRAEILITNFENAVALEDELTSLLRRYRGRGILVVDESYFAKNLDAQRTQSLRRLREWCGRAFVLCGTPAPNAPLDIVQQFNLVDFGLTFEGTAIPKDRDAARPVVQRAMDERGLFVRHLKRDVLPSLPSKAFTRVMLEMQPEQKRLYEGALRNLILDLTRTDSVAFQRELSSFLGRRHALLQICSNPTGAVSGYGETPTKLLALDDILDELVTQRGEKVIIWSFYTASLEGVLARTQRYRPVRYDGSVGLDNRRAALREFQEGDSMVFVGNPAAAGAGLNLQVARFAIYESLSNQAAHYLQSIDRIHRRGQERPVEYITLLCDKTIEIVEFEQLQVKEYAATELLGDRTEAPPTREAMLDEALDLSRLMQGEA